MRIILKYNRNYCESLEESPCNDEVLKKLIEEKEAVQAEEKELLKQ